MICPTCAADGEPKASAGIISICATCGATCVVNDAGAAKLARFSDIETLTEQQMKDLRRARAPIVRPR